MARLLVISFSDLARDQRVARQVDWLTDAGYDVTVAALNGRLDGGYRLARLSPAPAAAHAGYIRTQALRLGRRWEAAYWSVPAFRTWRSEIPQESWDGIVVNDLFGLPLAFAVGGGAPVVFDAHEYAPEEFATSRAWNAIVAPQLRGLARRFIPQVAAMTTVSTGIARLYEALTGVSAVVVTNAPRFEHLSPGPVGNPIRIVHWGLADPQRQLEATIDVASRLEERFRLDLILIGDERYLLTLRARAAGNPRIRFLEPIDPNELARFGNAYDIGIFLLPPRHANQLHVLPNKFFEFVQARLAVAIGPSPEMATLARKYGFGIVAQDWTPGALANALNSVDSGDLAAMKEAAAAAASDLSAEHNAQLMLDVVAAALTTRRPDATRA
jgi:hypothetical protein